ncbi:hypothetical protein GCM10027052_10540 [Parafrigoribacterium mesophilum]
MSDGLSPKQAGLAAAELNLAAGEVIALDNGILTKVHSVAACSGPHCWVHNPSPHHMVTWPVRWRDDRRLAERICEHGIGHPDPDDVAFNLRLGRDVRVHGCDGCCGNLTTTKA